MKPISTTRRGLAAGLLSLLLVAAGCDNSNSDMADLRVIHASPDAPREDVKVGNKSLTLEDPGFQGNDEIQILADALLRLGERLYAFITRERNFARKASSGCGHLKPWSRY